MIRRSATSVAYLESIRDFISEYSKSEAVRFFKEIKIKVM